MYVWRRLNWYILNIGSKMGLSLIISIRKHAASPYFAQFSWKIYDKLITKSFPKHYLFLYIRAIILCGYALTWKFNKKTWKYFEKLRRCFHWFEWQPWLFEFFIITQFDPVTFFHRRDTAVFNGDEYRLYYKETLSEVCYFVWRNNLGQAQDITHTEKSGLVKFTKN